ncbi:MAG: YcxB family protein [Novosphingobium sp.]
MTGEIPKDGVTPLEFVGEVTRDDFQAVNAHIYLREWSFRRVIYGFLSGTFLMTAVATAGAGPSGAGFWADAKEQLGLGVAVSAVMLLTRFVVCWLQLRGASDRQYELTGTLAMPTNYRLSSEGFQSSYAEGSTNHPWTRFVDYLDIDGVFALRRTPGFMYLFAKRDLTPEQIDQFRTILAAAGIKPA